MTAPEGSLDRYWMDRFGYRHPVEGTAASQSPASVFVPFVEDEAE